MIKSAKKTYDIINHANYKFAKRAKENNELYGSIKPMEISRTIKNVNKIEIKPSQIDLSKEIKRGTHHIPNQGHGYPMCEITDFLPKKYEDQKG